MAGPSSGRHALNIALPYHRACAETVLVFECPLENIGDDLRVAVWMLGKPSPGATRYSLMTFDPIEI